MQTTQFFPMLLALVLALVSAGCSTAPPPGDDRSTRAIAPGSKNGLAMQSLLKSKLEGVDGTEVIVSQVTIPPNTSLPKHWHPGEEFAYVLEGAVTLWQKGKRDIVGKKGDVMKVPLKQVHTAVTGDEGVTLLVFRVHELGQPERVLAD
ncbi:MAG: cupin domain-containing protein [Verrucomicrobiales bacterium]